MDEHFQVQRLILKSIEDKHHETAALNDDDTISRFLENDEPQPRHSGCAEGLPPSAEGGEVGGWRGLLQETLPRAPPGCQPRFDCHGEKLSYFNSEEKTGLCGKHSQKITFDQN